MASMNLTVGIKNLKRGTNILDISVPEALRVKRSSGIEWVDDSLGGEGFTPSTAMMLTGGPGCGKTTMMLQLADSLTKQGHLVLLNTGEESLYQVKMVAERLGLKKGFYCGQDVMAPALLEHADEIRRIDPKRQMFLLQDSIQTLDDGKYVDSQGNSRGTTGSTPMRCVEMLTDWAKAKGPGGGFGIVVFIGQVNKAGDFSGKNGIKHAIDVHGHLYFDEDQKSTTYGERLFEVQKNRFGCNGKTYIIGMDKNGLREKGNFSKANMNA